MTHLGCMEDYQASHVLSNLKDLDGRRRSSTLTVHQHVHIAGYYNISGFWHGKLQSKLKEMHEMNSKSNNDRMTVSLVPQHDATNTWDGGLIDLLHYVDFLILSEVETKHIIKFKGDNDDDGEHSDFQHHIAEFPSFKSSQTYIIVTLGSNGAVAFWEGQLIYDQRTIPIDNPIDPTGAGDAFAAGFLHGFLSYISGSKCGIEGDCTQQKAVEQGMKLGCAVGTSCIAVQGASVPSTKESIEHTLNSIDEAHKSNLKRQKRLR